MSAVSFLRDLTVVLLAASAALIVFQRLRLPPVLGYLVAGLLLGPHTPPFPLVSDIATLEALAEVGVVFLLFALGLEFNLGRLARAGARAVFCAVVEAGLLIGAGAALSVLAGVRLAEGLLLGGVVALASTAVVARSLMESEEVRRSPWAELVAGMLIAEDVIAVILIALASSAGRLGTLDLGSIVHVLVGFGAMATIVLAAGLLILPRLLSTAERAGVKEVPTLLVIGTCFGVSLLTHALGFSAALGAFLAGALVSESGGRRLHETVEPFKDVFGGVFFVAVGMMIDPGWVVENWKAALALGAGVVLVRTAANTAGLWAAGVGRVAAVQASLVMLPIGEFSFILAQIAQREGLVDAPIYLIAVLLSLSTIAASSVLQPLALRSPRTIERLFPLGLARFLDEYEAGVRRLSVPRRVQVVVDLTRPSFIQIFINAMVLTGAFLGAAWLLRERGWTEPVPGAAWAVTAVLTLPFLLALWRKTQAVALILLEAVAPEDSEGRPPAEARPKLTRLVLGAATLAVAWLYLSISLPLLPRGTAALGAAAVIGVAGALLWRGANRLYSRIQASLKDTLARSKAEQEAAPELVSYLVEQGEGVRVLTLRLTPVSRGLGRSLAELDLRGTTGASVLQINRRGSTLVAPPAATSFEVGDEVLLVGSEEQVGAARELLA